MADSGLSLSFFSLKLLIKIAFVSTCSIIPVASVYSIFVCFSVVEHAVSSKVIHKIKMIEV
ncbi:conserved hypothetical protein, partial [Listeria innocua FSL S4-378]